MEILCTYPPAFLYISPIDYVGYFSLCDAVAYNLVSCVNYDETIFCVAIRYIVFESLS